METKQKAGIPQALKSAAATMAADALVIIGFVFLLLGIAKFINEFIDIPGIGEGAVGAALLVSGLIVLMRSKMRVRFAQVPQRPPGMMQPMMPPPQPPPKEAPSESYR